MAALAALVALVALVPGLRAAECPPAEQRQFYAPDGAFSFAPEAPAASLLCLWSIRYSDGPTSGRVTVSSSVASPNSRLTLYGSVDRTVVLGSFSSPLVDATQFSTTGVFLVELETTDLTTLTVEFSAINAAPVVTPVPVRRSTDEVFGLNRMVLSYLETSPLPWAVVDYDNFDRGLYCLLRIERVTGEADDTLSVFELPEPPAEIVLANGPREIELTGPASAVVAVLETVQLVLTNLQPTRDTLSMTLSDFGNSGLPSGSPSQSTYFESLVTECVGFVEFGPENGTVSAGIERLENSRSCSFLVVSAFRLRFRMLELEVADDPNTEIPCNDYVRVWDGDSPETGALLSTDLARTGEICGALGSLLPTYESVTGSFYIELRTDDSDRSDGFEADVENTPGEFSVAFVDIPDDFELAAASGLDALLPQLSVFDLPARNVTVRVTSTQGTLGIQFQDSFQDIIVAQSETEIVLAFSDPVRSPMFRVAPALAAITFRSSESFLGQDTVLFQAFSGSQASNVARMPVIVRSYGLSVVGELSTNAFSVAPIAVALAVPPGELVTLRIETQNPDGATVLSTDPRAGAGIDMGYAWQLVLQGTIDEVAPRAAHLVYQSVSTEFSDVISLSLVGVRGEVTASVAVTIDPQCTGTRNIYGLTGAITDRVGLGRYSADAECIWHVFGPSVMRVTRFQIESGSASFVVLDGDGGETIYFYFGFFDPNRLETTTNQFWVNFDAINDQGRGFDAVFSLEADENGIPIVVVPDAGDPVVRSGRHTLDLVFVRDFDTPDDETIDVTITVDGGELELDAARASAVQIVEQTQIAVTVRGTFVALDSLVTTTAVAAPALLGAFTVSVTAVDAQGATATASYATRVIPCSSLAEVQIDPDGQAVVTDGSGLQSYSPGLTCSWRLSGARAPAILDFDFLDLEVGQDACTDVLVVYDGVSASGRLLGELCSRESLLRGSLIALSGSFYVQMSTNAAVERDGFSALYSSLESAQWASVGSVPSDADPERAFAGLVVLEAPPDHFVMLGGDNGFGSILSPLIFDPVALWRPLASTGVDQPQPRSRAAVTSLGGPVLLLMGGQSSAGEVFGDVWVGQVDIAADAIVWEPLVVEPLAVAGASALRQADPRFVLVFGGRTAAGGVADDLWELDTQDGVRTRITPLSGPAPAPRHLHSVLADPSDQGMYVYGGLDASDSVLRDVWRFEAATRQWQELPGVGAESAISFAGFGLLGPEIAVVGDDAMWVYDASVSSWIEVADAGLPGIESAVSPVMSAGGLVYGGRDALFVFAEQTLHVVTLGVSVSAIAPQLTPLQGGTVMTLTGERLDRCTALACRFESVGTTAATVVRSREAICTTPVTVDDGPRTVTMVCDADEFVLTRDMLFFSGPDIVDVIPAVLVPGTQVQFVLGPGSQQALGRAVDSMCEFRFGSTELRTPADLLPDAVQCPVPEELDPGMSLQVRVSLDGQQFSGAGVSVQTAVASSSTTTEFGLLSALLVGVALLAIVGALFMGRTWHRRAILMRMAGAKAPWQIPFEQLEIGDAIASGSFGVVYRGMFRRTEVAIKLMQSHRELTVQMINAFRDESALMAELRHPNLVLFMGACTIPPNIAIVLEFCAHGSLYDLIHDEEVQYGFTEIRKMALDIVKGMAYLHAADPPIIHRDLKSLNVLVDSNWTMKVSDFGLTQTAKTVTVTTGADPAPKGVAAIREEQEHASASSMLEIAHEGAAMEDIPGSVYWAAPELLLGQDATQKSDVYAFGVTLWEIAVRENPFEGVAPLVVGTQVLAAFASGEEFRPSIEATLPGEIETMIRACWRNVAQDRPDFSDLFSTLANEMGGSAVQDTASTAHSMSARTDDYGAPMGEAMVMFVGVENAVELWERDAMAMRDALKVLHKTLMKALRSNGGYLVSQDREIVFLVFQTAMQAVLFSLQLQQDLLAARWPERLEQIPEMEPLKFHGDVVLAGLRVFVGMHYGRPETNPDPRTRRMQYDGPVVHTASRVAGVARGGQIVLSDTATDRAVLERVFDLEQVVGIEMEAMVGGEKPLQMMAVYHRLHEARHRLLWDELGGTGHTGVDATGRTGGDWASLVSNPRWVIDLKSVEIGRPIGAGSFGTVHMGTWLGTPVAVKTLFRKRMAQQQTLDLRAEVGVSSTLRHPNVCQFLGICIEPDRLCILTEFVSRGSIHDAYISKRAVRLGSLEKILMARDTARGMSYLHGVNILHRDLKPRNLLVNETWEVKITDFGLSRTKSENQTMTKCGTGGYMAPEVLRGARYGSAADVFSFGISLWEILYKDMAFRRAAERAGRGALGVIGQMIVDGERPNLGPPPDEAIEVYLSILQNSWADDPAQRPSFSDSSQRLSAVYDQLKKDRDRAAIEEQAAAIRNTKKKKKSRVGPW